VDREAAAAAAYRGRRRNEVCEMGCIDRAHDGRAVLQVLWESASASMRERFEWGKKWRQNGNFNLTSGASLIGLTKTDRYNRFYIFIYF
jgi:hypothetical protein